MHSFPHVASTGDFVEARCRMRQAIRWKRPIAASAVSHSKQGISMLLRAGIEGPRQLRETHRIGVFPGILAPAPHRTAHTDP